MVAYAAVNSLLHTINLILNSSRLSLASSTREILESAHHRVESLQHTLENYDEIKNSSEGVLEQDATIREEVRRLEDAIESHFVSQSDELIHPHHLTQDIDRFVETTKTMEVGYIVELYKEEEDAAASSNSSSLVTDCGGNEFDDMVGSSDHFLTVRNSVLFRPVWVSGMVGIGKTALAKKVFHEVESHIFECRAFVRVGQKYKLEEILRAIIVQVDNNQEMIMEKDEGLDEYFKRVMEGRYYLIYCVR